MEPPGPPPQAPEGRLKTLFLCTGNSARSILGEHLLRQLAADRFETWSAGASPTGRVHPLALRVLDEDYGVDASGARSKSWEEVRQVPFDLVVTVCDHARESCPIWPGQPMLVHWGMPDPAAAEGSAEERYQAFRRAGQELHRRLLLLAALPFETLDRPRLTELAQEIGLC